MWLYARRKKGILKNKSPYYPHNPHEGFIKKIEISSDKYYDFMVYDRKLSIASLIRFRLVFVGTIIEDIDDGY